MKRTTLLKLILMLTLVGSGSAQLTAADTIAPLGKAALVMMAKQIILPEFKLDAVKLNDAVRALQEAGKRYDVNHRGVNFFISVEAKPKAGPVITLDLKNVTLAEAAEQLAQSAGLSVTAMNVGFVFHPDVSKQIADALDLANKEHKCVLLEFVRGGAVLTGRCYKWQTLLQTHKSIRETLRKDYVVESIDMNYGLNQDINERYGHPTRFELPFLIVIDSHGKQHTGQTTGQFEEGGHFSREKVVAFLKQWSSEK